VLAASFIMALLFSALAIAVLFGTVQASTELASIPKPSVPEFTLKYIDYSYDVPPTYGIDQYTGQNVTIQAGYHVDNRTVVFTIKNQPFTPYNDSSGNYIGLYYNFRFKGHYGDEWTYYPFDGVQTTHSYGPYTGGLFHYYSASNSDYTVISINLDTLTKYPTGTQPIPDGSQVDFQVQAQIGHIDPISSGLLAGDFYSFTGEASDWSSTQTITIGESQTPAPSPATTPTPTSTPEPTSTPYQEPQQTEQSEIIVGAAIAAAVIGAGLGLLIYLIKRK